MEVMFFELSGRYKSLFSQKENIDKPLIIENPAACRESWNISPRQYHGHVAPNGLCLYFDGLWSLFIFKRKVTKG
ncbi:hypothetical protein SRABI96_04426 [Peribacillus sp. Bi96]|nr:hypothetical protein SRABI96_04426 [Peribacillus sp. Bi96]